MCFAILKMSGNLTLQMCQFLHFPEGGKDIVVIGFLVWDIYKSFPHFKRTIYCYNGYDCEGNLII